VTGRIERGILVYLGVEQGDADTDLDYLVDKCVNLRIFTDNAGKMNRSVADVGGAVMAVSQFTLCADTRKGRRPSYNHAAEPSDGEYYYRRFIEAVSGRGLEVAEGLFAAHMQVTYTNDGPVTIILDSRKRI
jgi:D-tyrosyl-tRNA(Tyr) deacylase